MAWVSIHDNVIGGKLRELAKELDSTQEEALGILASLWIWGLNNATKEGWLMSADKDDVLEAFSVKLATKMAPINIVDCLIKTRWIDEPEDGVLLIHDWDRWQEQWYKAMERREKDAERKANSRKGKMDQQPQPAQPVDVTPKPPAGEEATSGEAPKKPKHIAKPKPVKKEYAEFVHLLEVEHEKLVKQFGEAATAEFIKKLDNYKGANKKTYADDYRAILNWVVDRVRKDSPWLFRAASAEEGESGGNPFSEWEEKEQ